MSTTTLADEIGKQEAFSSPHEEALLNILRTAARLNDPFDRLFREHGVSDPLYNVLRIVRGVGGEGPALGEIGPRMISASPDVPRLVDRLEKLGLAERRRDTADRRVVRVRITPKGRRVLAKIDPVLAEGIVAGLDHLSDRELTSINKLMVKARRRATSSDDD